MKPITLLALACFLSTSIPTSHAADAPIMNQQSKKLRRKITQTVEANYLLFLPKDYQPRDDKRWPMILFLHGAGERGSNLSKVTVHGPPKIVKSKPEFPFIVVSPQCPSGKTWSDDVLLALIDDVTKKYKVDHSRIYLTGLSMGGFGTWSLGLKHPDRFAALAPICGGGTTLSALLPDAEIKDRLKTLPIWAFHGAKDSTVRLEESERLVNALKRAGNNAKLTIYPEAGHDSWTETYNNPALYDWFLEQQNPLVTPDGRPKKR